MRPLNIIIIAAVDLPEGGGDTTRLKTMANAVKAAGHNVRILLENPSGNTDKNLLQTEGEINGMPFRYILGNVDALKGMSFFTSKYKAVKLLSSAIKEIHRKEKVDVVWFNQLAAHTIYPITRLCKKEGIKTIQSYEDDRVKGTGLKRRLIYANQILADNYLTKDADALVVISHYLKDKFQKLTGGKVPVSIIPTVVDTDKWRMSPEKHNEVPVLLYYGGFFGFDEIEKMIEAVKILKDKGRPVKLNMAGYSKKKPEYMEAIARLIKDLGLSHEVELKGFTKHDKLRDYIEESNILLGLRKDDEWSQTGLSTKLSEYLATGRMVIATAIGDNTKYMQDGKSAMLMVPGCTPAQLAAAIEKAVTDDALRLAIGEEGRKVAEANFDTEVVKKNINAMLHAIVA